jgi:hypothetical protein
LKRPSRALSEKQIESYSVRFRFLAHQGLDLPRCDNFNYKAGGH